MNEQDFKQGALITTPKFNSGYEINVNVSKIEIGDRSIKELQKDVNLKCHLVFNFHGHEWACERFFMGFENMHRFLSEAEDLRGIILPKVPLRRATMKTPNLESFKNHIKTEYTEFLTCLLSRSATLTKKELLDFIQAPQFLVDHVWEILRMERDPIRTGVMKKEGEKYRKYRSRYFVLSKNYLLKYYEDSKAFDIGVEPKGCIDLYYAVKVYKLDDNTNPYSFGILQRRNIRYSHDLEDDLQNNGVLLNGIGTAGSALGIRSEKYRVWKLQCTHPALRDEWVILLNKLLQAKNATMQQAEQGGSVRATVLQNSRVSTQSGSHYIHVNEVSEDDSSEEKEIKKQAQLKQEIHKVLNGAPNVQRNMRMNPADSPMSKGLYGVSDKYQCSLCLNDILYKFPKPNASLIPTPRNCTYIQDSNVLFWYDAQANATNCKMIHVKKIEYSDESIEDVINFKQSWFKVYGIGGIALFACQSKEVSDKWIHFIQVSLEQQLS